MTQAHPKIAAPGGGLPTSERLLAKVALRIKCWQMTDEAAMNLLSKEAIQIGQRVRSIKEPEGSRRILIKRVLGIEDNSRYWSLYMVLDHLNIVNQGIAGIIDALCTGSSGLQAVQIADVKPDPTVSVETIEAFASGLQSYKNKVKLLFPLRSTTTHLHPWFGAMNAHQWHCLAALHHSIHRRQIEKILKQLDQ